MLRYSFARRFAPMLICSAQQLHGLDIAEIGDSAQKVRRQAKSGKADLLARQLNAAIMGRKYYDAILTDASPAEQFLDSFRRLHTKSNDDTT